MTSKGEPNAPSPTPRLGAGGDEEFLGVRVGIWKASFASALVLGMLTILWLRFGGTPADPSELYIGDVRIDGVYEVVAARQGCELEPGTLDEAPYFVLRYGPGASVLLHGCADEATCASVQRRDALGIGPAPIPPAADPASCCGDGTPEALGEALVAEPRDDLQSVDPETVPWRDTLVFPVLLLADDTGAGPVTGLIDDRHHLRQGRGFCRAFRYLASWRPGPDEGTWVLRRETRFAERQACGVDQGPEWAASIESCVDAREWTVRLDHR